MPSSLLAALPFLLVVVGCAPGSRDLIVEVGPDLGGKADDGSTEGVGVLAWTGRIEGRVEVPLSAAQAQSLARDLDRMRALAVERARRARSSLAERGFTMNDYLGDVSIRDVAVDDDAMAFGYTGTLYLLPRGEDVSEQSFEVELADADAVTIAIQRPRPAEGSCEVTSMAVKRGWATADAQGYSFTAHVEVTGERLTRCEVRQLASVEERNWDWTGEPESREAILGGYERGLKPMIGRGFYVTDTGWGWDRFRDDGTYSQRDSQIHNVENRSVVIDVDDERYRRTEVQRNSTKRSFVVEVRGRANHELAAAFVWSYDWDNEDALLEDGHAAAMDVGLGRFSACVGITGLHELNADDEPCGVRPE